MFADEAFDFAFGVVDGAVHLGTGGADVAAATHGLGDAVDVDADGFALAAEADFDEGSAGVACAVLAGDFGDERADDGGREGLCEVGEAAGFARHCAGGAHVVEREMEEGEAIAQAEVDGCEGFADEAEATCGFALLDGGVEANVIGAGFEEFAGEGHDGAVDVAVAEPTGVGGEAQVAGFGDLRRELGDFAAQDEAAEFGDGLADGGGGDFDVSLSADGFVALHVVIDDADAIAGVAQRCDHGLDLLEARGVGDEDAVEAGHAGGLRGRLEKLHGGRAGDVAQPHWVGAEEPAHGASRLEHVEGAGGSERGADGVTVGLGVRQDQHALRGAQIAGDGLERGVGQRTAVLHCRA